MPADTHCLASAAEPRAPTSRTGDGVAACGSTNGPFLLWQLSMAQRAHAALRLHELSSSQFSHNKSNPRDQINPGNG